MLCSYIINFKLQVNIILKKYIVLFEKKKHCKEISYFRIETKINRPYCDSLNNWIFIIFGQLKLRVYWYNMTFRKLIFRHFFLHYKQLVIRDQNCNNWNCTPFSINNFTKYLYSDRFYQNISIKYFCFKVEKLPFYISTQIIDISHFCIWKMNHLLILYIVMSC